MTCIMGIDPGIGGGLAVLNEAKLVDVIDMPVFNGRVNGTLIAEYLDRWEPDYVVVEDSHAMPKQGVVSSFNFGLSTGIVIGAIQGAKYPLIRIASGVWKMQMGMRGKTKSDSRGLAAELWPDFVKSFQRAKDDGRAEAALLARWYCHQLIIGANAAAPEYEADGTLTVLRNVADGHRGEPSNIFKKQPTDKWNANRTWGNREQSTP